MSIFIRNLIEFMANLIDMKTERILHNKFAIATFQINAKISP